MVSERPRPGKAWEHNMDMVRHDTPRKQPIAFLVEMAQSVSNVFLRQLDSACDKRPRQCRGNAQ